MVLHLLRISIIPRTLGSVRYTAAYLWRIQFPTRVKDYAVERNTYSIKDVVDNNFYLKATSNRRGTISLIEVALTEGNNYKCLFFALMLSAL